MQCRSGGIAFLQIWFARGILNPASHGEIRCEPTPLPRYPSITALFIAPHRRGAESCLEQLIVGVACLGQRVGFEKTDSTAAKFRGTLAETTTDAGATPATGPSLRDGLP